jgi:hydrocephalus-inducing protein
MSLRVTNESTIDAEIDCLIDANVSNVFTCEPTSLTLAPGAWGELTVTARFLDTELYSGNLVLAVKDGRAIQIALSGRGVGSPLITSPDIDGAIDLGRQFSRRECVRAIKVTNGSSRPQMFQFSLDSPPAGVSGHCTVMRGASYQKKRTPACPNPPDPSRSCFGVWPEKVILDSNATVIVELRGLSNGVGPVAETLLCHSSFEGNNSQRLVATCNVTADFILPVIAATPSSVAFEFVKTNGSAEFQRETKVCKTSLAS